MAKNCALYVAKNCAVLLAEKCVLYLTIYTDERYPAQMKLRYEKKLRKEVSNGICSGPEGSQSREDKSNV
ncbi:MAG: hypothetical protein EOM48_10310 [Bacilli bacterium]|nr:hypothetical protein [Bacilli bacterium]